MGIIYFCKYDHEIITAEIGPSEHHHNVRLLFNGELDENENHFFYLGNSPSVDEGARPLFHTDILIWFMCS